MEAFEQKLDLIRSQFDNTIKALKYEQPPKDTSKSKRRRLEKAETWPQDIGRSLQVLKESLEQLWRDFATLKQEVASKTGIGTYNNIRPPSTDMRDDTLDDDASARSRSGLVTLPIEPSGNIKTSQLGALSSDVEMSPEHDTSIQPPSDAPPIEPSGTIETPSGLNIEPDIETPSSNSENQASQPFSGGDSSIQSPLTEASGDIKPFSNSNSQPYPKSFPVGTKQISLKVNKQEWDAFSALYERIKHHDITLVEHLSIPVERGVARPVFKSFWRQTLHWKNNGQYAIVDYQEVKQPVKWTVPCVPPEEADPEAIMARWLNEFGPANGDRVLLPDYAANLDAVSTEDRASQCLPERSPIYPLQGNCLLERVPDMGGITLSETFSARRFGPVFTLHDEDFCLPSLNHIDKGLGKLWITTPRSARPMLVRLLQKLGLVPSDSTLHQQSIRHASVFLPPPFLQKNSIPYGICYQPRGQTIVVGEGVLHQGINCGPNIAEALNYAPYSWIPPRIDECGKDACGQLHPITYSMLMPLEEREEESGDDENEDGVVVLKAIQKRRMTKVVEHDAIESPPKDSATKAEWVSYIKRHSRTAIDTTPQLQSKYFRQALALRSRECVIDTCQIIRTWKANRPP